MKIITISKIGYNHPSQANWNYTIWKLDLIDSKEKYCMSHTLSEKFGGDDRLKRTLKDNFNIEIIETKSVYTGTGTQKITGVSSLLDIESKEVIDIIKDFLK